MNSVITVENLFKQYDKAKKPSVDNISFNVGEGEFFALLGPNGAGKTTTISILTTTLNKTSGNINIAGYDLDKEAKKVREEIGIIFQKPSLDESLSAEENIRLHCCLYGLYSYKPFFRMMPTSYKNRIMELAEIVGIKDSIFKRLSTFSGGMQRKLEIVRSLMHNPKILFLDEPTQGLDAVSRRSLWDYLNKVRKENGSTIFLTTHYLDEAESVDRVCIVDKGRIALLGSPEAMKEKLLRNEIILDSDNPKELEKELINMGLKVNRDNHLTVTYKNRTPQQIISNLKTRLTLLKIHEPSLEDAYIHFLKQNGGELI